MYTSYVGMGKFVHIRNVNAGYCGVYAYNSYSPPYLSYGDQPCSAIVSAASLGWYTYTVCQIDPCKWQKCTAALVRQNQQNGQSTLAFPCRGGIDRSREAETTIFNVVQMISSYWNKPTMTTSSRPDPSIKELLRFFASSRTLKQESWKFWHHLRFSKLCWYNNIPICDFNKSTVTLCLMTKIYGFYAKNLQKLQKKLVQTAICICNMII